MHISSSVSVFLIDVVTPHDSYAWNKGGLVKLLTQVKVSSCHGLESQALESLVILIFNSFPIIA